MSTNSLRNPVSTPVFYDFEATGLDGIPVEVGWAYFDAENERIESEAHLILASSADELTAAWDDWAEELHGITLATVLRNGKAPATVLNRMNTVLAGRELFADSPFDLAWLRQLYELTDLDPTFQMRVMLSSALCDRLAVIRNISVAQYAPIKVEVTRTSPITHRADADARYWATLWLAIARCSASVS